MNVIEGEYLYKFKQLLFVYFIYVCPRRGYACREAMAYPQLLQNTGTLPRSQHY